jgi:uncharacterized protein
MDFLTRGIEARLASAWSSSPVVVVEGPRAIGKTTLVRDLAVGSNFVDLSDEHELARARESVRAWVESLTPPVAIDEAQLVPGLSVALKRRVDSEGGKPGQFLVTGSARLARDELGGSDPLLARASRIRMYPFAQSELEGQPIDVVNELFNGDPSRWSAPELTQLEMLDRLCVGGMPGVGSLLPERRSEFFDSFAAGTFHGGLYETKRNRELIVRLFRWLTSQSGQLVDVTKFARAVEISRTSVEEYLTELCEVFLIERIPAWRQRKEKRETDRDRFFVFDPAFVASSLGLPGQLSGPLLQSEHGAVFETFAATELLRLLSWSNVRGKLFHWRTGAGEEVDLIIEDQDTGKLVAFEVKASRDSKGEYFKGIRALRAAYPDRFHRGYVLNCGTRVARQEDDLWFLPYSALWTVGQPVAGQPIAQTLDDSSSVVSASLNSLRSKIRKRDPLLIYPDEQLEYQRLSEPLVEQMAANIEQLRVVLVEEGCEVLVTAVDSEEVFAADSGTFLNGVVRKPGAPFWTNVTYDLMLAVTNGSVSQIGSTRGSVRDVAVPREGNGQLVVLRGFALQVTQKEVQRHRTARMQLKISPAGVTTLEAWVFDSGNGKEDARWAEGKPVRVASVEWVDTFFGQFVDGLTVALMPGADGT